MWHQVNFHLAPSGLGTLSEGSAIPSGRCYRSRSLQGAVVEDGIGIVCATIFLVIQYSVSIVWWTDARNYRANEDLR